MKAVILAGGSGERFWPYSTMDRPKQFLHLFNNRSLLKNTYDRLRERFSSSDILIITSERFVNLTREELPELPVENILGEEHGKNTAAACMIGTLAADDNEQILIVPADHYIGDVDRYWESFERAVRSMRDHDGIHTFGITPTREETGYGYIELGDEISPGVNKARSFIEKPGLVKARSFAASGKHLWNSGMFLWKRDTFLREMEKWAPSVFIPLKGVDPREARSVNEAYRSVESISIDHALLERSEMVYVVKGDFSWSDIGSWLSIMEMEGPSNETDSIALPGSSNILVKSMSERKVAVVGLSDVIVVESEEGLLVCSSEHSQMVKEAVSHFRKYSTGK